jgi:hypothetical protein
MSVSWTNSLIVAFIFTLMMQKMVVTLLTRLYENDLADISTDDNGSFRRSGRRSEKGYDGDEKERPEKHENSPRFGNSTFGLVAKACLLTWTISFSCFAPLTGTSK